MSRKTSTVIPFSKAHGNALVEYTLIGILLVGASIIVFLSFGQNFKNALADLHSDMKAHNDQASFMEAQAQANMVMADMTGSTAGLSSASNNPAMAQTTGANGNQVGLGNTGSSTAPAKPLTAEEQLKSLLVQLANQAHEVAQLQSMLESISKYSKGDLEKFQSTSIYYNGQVLNAWQLSWALSHGGEIVALQQKKNEVLASGASDSVKDKISQLTDLVTHNAAATSQTTNSVLHGNQDPGDVSTVSNSNATHQDAGKICGVSGHADNGSSCTASLK